MSLPNYTPKGTIKFGAVPWSNAYGNVRLYNSLSEQQSDISSMMTISSEDYVYIGRNRRLKVSIPADRLYHCNYCMYRNETITDGWIYCFISDVEYINDNTAEISLETDIFQTYLYGTDWTIPPCFIERETVPSESSKYLLTSEPEMPLIYTCVKNVNKSFSSVAGFAMMCNTEAEAFGIITKPVEPSITKGTYRGANIYYCPVENYKEISDKLNLLNQAGSIESVVAIWSIPEGFYPGDFKGWNNQMSFPDPVGNVNMQIKAPALPTTIDGYTPQNKKLLYYPYTFCRLTDYNGAISELRYELWKEDYYISVKYEPDPTCQAIVYPMNYMGVYANIDAGFTTNCGAIGSWTNTGFQNWVGQNAGTIISTAAMIALPMYGATQSIAKANKAFIESQIALREGGNSAAAKMINYKNMELSGKFHSQADQQVRQASENAINLGATLTNASRIPNTQKGTTNYNVSYMTGLQGIHAQQIQVIASIAEQIDEFFTKWGYAVERIESVNITSRPAFNYVKTGGAAAKSYNVGSDNTAPFSRGRGTPADALAVINQAFDGGITFWHTTSNFGNYALNNSL